MVSRRRCAIPRTSASTMWSTPRARSPRRMRTLEPLAPTRLARSVVERWTRPGQHVLRRHVAQEREDAITHREHGAGLERSINATCSRASCSMISAASCGDASARATDLGLWSGRTSTPLDEGVRGLDLCEGAGACRGSESPTLLRKKIVEPASDSLYFLICGVSPSTQPPGKDVVVERAHSTE